MSKLEAPLRRLLTERVDEHAVQRIWGAVRARRGGSSLVKRRNLPAWGWPATAALVLALAVLIGLRQHALSPPQRVASGPLTSRAGAALSVLGSANTSRDELSDGSSINLDAGSQLEVLENTSKTFVSVLRRGHGSFSVRPGGPRRWTIEAGLATVEVVGTRFSVTRRETAVDVAVEHGVVLVRSDLIRDHVQRLTAGQQLSIQLPSVPVSLAPAPKPTSSTRDAAPASGAPPLVSSLEGLLNAATEQRRRGDVRGAEASLRRALSEHPSEPQTALIAFTLGKLLLDSAGQPAEAARLFERCLAAAPPSALAEDALFRLVQARSQAGDAEGASASARRYQALYPDGRHVRDVERWVIAH